MWTVDQIETRERQLDFSSSELGRHRSVRLLADGIEIVNALDFVDIEAGEVDGIQLMVCEHCGTPGCQSGGRVSIRRLEDGLIMIPDFAAMARGEWERSEHGPPIFLEERGAPLFRGSALDVLLSKLPALGDRPGWQPLSYREAALLLQWEAPGQVLGGFPEPPRLRQNRIVAVSHGSRMEEEFGALAELLGAALREERPVSVMTGETVTFYLEDAGFPEWAPLVLTGSGYRLALAPGLGVA